MGKVFIGSEAVASGDLTRHELQRWYRSIFRGVYVSKLSAPSLRERTVGAWLSSSRQAGVAGVAASALHGAEWVDADVTIEMISRNVRPQRGLLVRNESLADDEITHVGGLPVTTPARTAFDLGRHLRRGQALARRVAPGNTAAVASDRRWFSEAHDADTRVRRLGAHRRARLGAPPACGGHQTNRRQYVKDMRRIPKIERNCWIDIRVIAEDRDDDVIDRVYRAMVSRGWKP